MAMNLSTCGTLLSLFVVACITCAEAAPVLVNITSSIVVTDTDNANETATSDGFEFFAPNCSLREPLDVNLSNRTHWDFAIGLNIMKDDLKVILVSIKR
jgi:hypothetical protein